MRMILTLLLMLFALSPAAAQQAVHGGPVRALAVGEDGTLASAGFDQAMILWGALRPSMVVRWHTGAVNALAALPGGGFASAGEDPRIALWPARPGAEPVRILPGHEGPVAALVASETRLASASWDGTGRVWDLAGGAPPRVLRGHQGPVNAVAFRGDGLVATAGFDGALLLWPEADQPMTLGAFGLPLNALVALPGDALAVGGADGLLRLVAREGAVRQVRAGARPIVALAASPDGSRIAAASLGGSVTIWDLAALRLLHTLEGPGLPVWSVAWAPDGGSLWTGGTDRQVRRWDALSGRPLGPAAAPMSADPGADPAAAATHPEGARVFRACAACHALQPDAGPMAGPSLHGLFGRRMGSLPAYGYSERLARGDIVWSRETVADLFTRGPDVVTPGTRMPVQTIGNAEDLSELLDFLEAATR